MTKQANIIVPAFMLLVGVLLGILLNRAFTKRRVGFETTRPECKSES